MNRTNTAQLETARRLLAYEGASASDRAAPAASRVYDKLVAHIAPLMGDAGVQLLFVRSAKLSQGEFACLAEVSILEGSVKLRQCLQAKDPAIATDTAVTFFGNFFALMTELIGERLTTDVVQRAWPIHSTASGEIDK